MAETPLHNLECFEWLPVERWTAKMLLSDPNRDGGRYCKVCDKTIPENDAEKHATFHRNEWKKVKVRRAAEAKKAREEGKKRAAENRKALREAAKNAKAE
jgi:hypothetical protein